MYGVARDVTERHQAEAELARLAGEQAALRRVATLVARGVPPAEVFSAVAEEVDRLLDAQATAIARLEPDGMMAIVASGGTARNEHPVGTRLGLDSDTAMAKVMQTGQSARVKDYRNSSELIAQRVRRLGIRCSVAVPIIVEGALWGSISAGTEREQFPADAERRMTEFTELAGTAIANAESQSELIASRARVVAASDEARRRFERDLHDGAQQRLVSLALELQSAESLTPEDLEDLRAQLSRVGEGLTSVFDDLRELSRGIHPAILSEGGLEPALRALARRSAVPVKLEVRIDGRLGEGIEVAAYYVVSEALANVAKHADASVAEVNVEARNGVLDLMITDNGMGGADPAKGSGLVGLKDRVEALDGTIAVVSPPGAGTSVRVELPAEPPTPWPPRH